MLALVIGAGVGWISAILGDRIQALVVKPVLVPPADNGPEPAPAA